MCIACTPHECYIRDVHVSGGCCEYARMLCVQREHHVNVSQAYYVGITVTCALHVYCKCTPQHTRIVWAERGQYVYCANVTQVIQMSQAYRMGNSYVRVSNVDALHGRCLYTAYTYIGLGDMACSNDMSVIWWCACGLQATGEARTHHVDWSVVRGGNGYILQMVGETTEDGRPVYVEYCTDCLRGVKLGAAEHAYTCPTAVKERGERNNEEWAAWKAQLPEHDAKWAAKRAEFAEAKERKRAQAAERAAAYERKREAEQHRRGWVEGWVKSLRQGEMEVLSREVLREHRLAPALPVVCGYVEDLGEEGRVRRGNGLGGAWEERYDACVLTYIVHVLCRNVIHNDTTGRRATYGSPRLRRSMSGTPSRGRARGCATACHVPWWPGLSTPQTSSACPQPCSVRGRQTLSWDGTRRGWGPWEPGNMAETGEEMFPGRIISVH